MHTRDTLCEPYNILILSYIYDKRTLLTIVGHILNLNEKDVSMSA